MKYVVISLLLLTGAVGVFFTNKQNPAITFSPTVTTEKSQVNDNPLSIDAMRARDYPGSDLVKEQTLSPTNNYSQYIASYMSDGLKIYGLLTVPTGEKPERGWPVIIFNHGYIPPEQYNTTERYVAYVDAFARNGYIVFKPDYRGHGNSQGSPEGAYYSPGYAVDVLHALASLKKYPGANPEKIGMWGHSLGGNITLRNVIVNTKDIKSAVIWGGVVGSYYDLANNWHRRVPFQPTSREQVNRASGRQRLTSLYGPPATASAFWQSIDPTAYLSEIATPIQLHAGGSDETVPPIFSQNLFTSLEKLGKIVEYYNYPGGDHDIGSPHFELAMDRSIAFFDKYLK